jgi:hypothetical protein
MSKLQTTAKTPTSGTMLSTEPQHRWAVRYLDEYRDPVKGEVGPGWGFKIDTDFYIISAMASRRYLDLVGTSAVVKTPNARTS